MPALIRRTLLPPLFAALLLAVIAAASYGAQESWIAPSLGAAAFSQMLHPSEKTGSPYNLFAGQILGGAAGFAAVFIAGQVHTHAFTGAHDLVAGRILAVLIAGALAAFLQIVFKARSPTGGATALVVALGVETATWSGALRLFIGIVLVVAIGEVGRRVLLKSEADPAGTSG